MQAKVVDVKLLDVIDRGSNVIVLYSQIFENGSKQIVRKNVKNLGGYYNCLNPKPIRSAECLSIVYCGIIKTDVRMLFKIILTDGSAQLIQLKEGSRECMKLLRICDINTVE